MLSIQCDFPWVYLKTLSLVPLSAPPSTHSPISSVGLAGTFLSCAKGEAILVRAWMRKRGTLTPESALVGGQGGLVWIESPGTGCEEGRRTKRTSESSGLNITGISINIRSLEAKYAQDGFCGHGGVSRVILTLRTCCRALSYWDISMKTCLKDTKTKKEIFMFRRRCLYMTCQVTRVIQISEKWYYKWLQEI